MTSIKPVLVVHPKRKGDLVPKEEKDSEDAAKRYLDCGVGLKQLTQIVNCSRRLIIVLEAKCEVYVEKTHPVNSVPS